MLAAVGDRARLLPLAYLPLEHPAVALAEYERVRGEARWAGLCAGAGGRSVSLADAALAPLWRALDADARLLLLHPGSSPDARLAEFYLANLLGNPVETAVAAAQLVFGDVLPAHPRMRVLLVHCGGCLPSVVGRWERGVATDRPGLKPLTESPRDAVRRLHVDCLAHDPVLVSQAVELFGPDKLLLGSDWPFPMGIDDPREQIAHLPAELRERVAVGNAKAALGI
ncbi:MAG TPA: amidohydrolase family protein [Conexibacter sp.]|nr:amidohydrolase family protein [Conexibacter sp.]